jgi:hypothetical protein
MNMPNIESIKAGIISAAIQDGKISGITIYTDDYPPDTTIHCFIVETVKTVPLHDFNDLELKID